MSGIVGVFNRNDDPLEALEISQMLDSVSHRGPDGNDTWLGEKAGFGHCMLWTTPESLTESLPITNQQGNLVITSDARIDNRAELLASLELDESKSITIGDSQLILASYEKWKDDCVQHLIGDFSFAIWDEDRQSLFCARDHIGVKPFYYSASDARFYFASEIKALIKLPKISREIDPVKIGEFLLLEFHDKVNTSYRDVLRLPPAHTLTVTSKSLSIKQYWKLDPNKELVLGSDEEYAAAFRKIFTEAVRCRLRSAFPTGSHLSGGLDSSSVTCVARDVLRTENREPLHTISNVFDDVPECDERQFIQEVLEGGDVVAHYVHADQFGPLTDVDDIRRYEDEALLGPSHHYPRRLAQKANDIGVRIVLDGLDGDNVVSHGLLRLSELSSSGSWKTFAKEAAAVARRHEQPVETVFKLYGLTAFQRDVRTLNISSCLGAAYNLRRHAKLSIYSTIWHWGLKPTIRKRFKRSNRHQQKRLETLSIESQPPYNKKLSLLQPKFIADNDFAARVQQFAAKTEEPTTAKAHHYQGLTHGVLPFVLEQMDRITATFGIEERHPFMDKRLVEFCLSLPAEQKLRHGWGRFVMRAGLADALPEKIRWRGGKTNMGPSTYQGLMKIDRALLEHKLANDIEKVANLVVLDVFWKAYSRLSSDRATESDFMLVWRVLIVANWMNNYT